MEITDNLKASVDSNLISCGLFLDFSKAFESVNHQILLDKGTEVRVPNQGALNMTWFGLFERFGLFDYLNPDPSHQCV